MQLTPLARHVIPVTSSVPNHHTRTRIWVADAHRHQGSPIATRIPPNTGFAKTSHSHATALLLAGVPVHVVSRRLGHADVQTTLQQYGHVTEDAELRAVAGWASFMAGWRTGQPVGDQPGSSS
jgi:integrase